VILQLSPLAPAGELSVVGMSPARNTIVAPTDAPIAIQFNQAVDPASVTARSFSAFGRGSGTVNGSFRLANNNQSVILDPADRFSAGELITVVLSADLVAEDMSPIRNQGYTYQFWTSTQSNPQLDLENIGSMTTNAGASSRPYGGIAADLDNDGWLDLTIVNEDTADLRVFMNQADGTGVFAPFQEPTYPVGNRASPSESADFDRDGNTDITVANINDNTVSVLLGKGDGTFSPQQLIRVGAAPRGITVLDAEGDGDMDIVNTNYGSNNLSMMLNDGAGQFGEPTFFDGGVGGEWSLMAGDMDNDGILDLVVGGSDSREIRVLAGNGNGTFTPRQAQSAGGTTWQIGLGDVNGDGNLDVSTANGRSDNGAIILGLGDGMLGTPNIYELKNLGLTGGNTWILATDLGDLDGDGDLDWVTSSFAGGGGDGDWLVLLNDGTGRFELFEEIDSPLAASCALLHDFDNDGDLDLGLIDEVADQLVLMQNAGARPLRAGDADQDFDFDQADVVQVQIAAKYLSGQAATWGQGDWDGAPGGWLGSPPAGDGLFNQMDIIAALDTGLYLTGPYTALRPDGRVLGDVDVIYVPEPAGFHLLAMGLIAGACATVPRSRTRIFGTMGLRARRTETTPRGSTGSEAHRTYSAAREP
jgi:hypothetical protein